MLACLRIVDPVVTRPEAEGHAEMMRLSPEGFYMARLKQLNATIVRFPRTMFTVSDATELQPGVGWGDGGTGPSHRGDPRADPAFGVHVKYASEYYGALQTCFRDRPLQSLGVN